MESEGPEEVAVVTAIKRFNGDAAGESQKRDPVNSLGLGGEFFNRAGEADVSQAGDVRELFRTPVLRRITLCV